MGAVLNYCILCILGKGSCTDGYCGPKVAFPPQNTRNMMLGRSGRTMTCLFHQTHDWFFGSTLHRRGYCVAEPPIEASLFEEKETSLDH